MPADRHPDRWSLPGTQSGDDIGRHLEAGRRLAVLQERGANFHRPTTLSRQRVGTAVMKPDEGAFLGYVMRDDATV